MAFSYFFRDFQTLDMIRLHVLPSLRTCRNIHIWDAGCAMGQEPYSLAIILRENMGSMIFRNVKIHATDIDEGGQSANIIVKGVYPEDQTKRIPDKILSRYFHEESTIKSFRISDEIRSRVEYQWHDLLKLKTIRKDFSLILCKNVLLHFKESERIAVIKMFYDSLREGGFFVTEQTQKMPRPVAGLWEQVVSNAQVFKKVTV